MKKSLLSLTLLLGSLLGSTSALARCVPVHYCVVDSNGNKTCTYIGDYCCVGNFCYFVPAEQER